MTNEQLIALWLQVFPNSHAKSQNVLGTDSYFKGFVLKDKIEWPSGYSDNDPLYYTARYNPETNTYKETACVFYVRPAKGSFLAMDSIKVRKVTIKNVTAEKLIARFSDIKNVVRFNVHNAFQAELIKTKV